MSDEQSLFQSWKRDAFIAAGAGVLVALTIGTVTLVMGNIGETEARQLVKAIIPTSRAFCASLMTVSSTILALMLTLIGIGGGSNVKLTDAHYDRILKIGFYDAILFSLTAVMFVMHCVPVYESDKIPEWWYPTIYYGVLSSASALAGGAVSIIILLYLALKDLVKVVGLSNADHRFAKKSESEKPDPENVSS